VPPFSKESGSKNRSRVKKNSSKTRKTINLLLQASPDGPWPKTIKNQCCNISCYKTIFNSLPEKQKQELTSVHRKHNNNKINVFILK